MSKFTHMVMMLRGLLASIHLRGFQEEVLGILVGKTARRVSSLTGFATRLG